jgi:hypothetical protein
VVRSRNHCLHGNATIRSLFVAVGVTVVINNIKVFSVSVEMQQWVTFALLSSYETFFAAVNNDKCYQSVSVFLPLLSGKQSASFLRRYTTVNCRLSGYTQFFHIISQTARF